MMQMLENRMVVGAYDPPPMPIDEASAEDMALFVADDDLRICAVLGEIDLIDLWEHLPDDYIERISVRYARSHPEAFNEWRGMHGKV